MKTKTVFGRKVNYYVDEDGCHIAVGRSLNSAGYVNFGFKCPETGKYRNGLHSAVAFEKANRNPGELHAHHKCHKPTCCNPDCIEWASLSDHAKEHVAPKTTRYSDSTVLLAVYLVHGCGWTMQRVSDLLGPRRERILEWCTGRSRGKLTGIPYTPKQLT